MRRGGCKDGSNRVKSCAQTAARQATLPAFDLAIQVEHTRRPRVHTTKSPGSISNYCVSACLMRALQNGENTGVVTCSQTALQTNNLLARCACTWLHIRATTNIKQTAGCRRRSHIVQTDTARGATRTQAQPAPSQQLFCAECPWAHKSRINIASGCMHNSLRCSRPELRSHSTTPPRTGCTSTRVQSRITPPASHPPRPPAQQTRPGRAHQSRLQIGAA